MPSDGDSGRPDEDTFGVSFLPNDVDATAAKDIAPGLSGAAARHNTKPNCCCQGTLGGSLFCVLTNSAAEEQSLQNAKRCYSPFFSFSELYV